MAEQVGGAPQELATVPGLKFLQVIDRFGEAGAKAGGVLGIGHHVDIVETIERQVELFDEGKARLALGACRLRRVGAGQPGALEGAGTEHVAARPAEGVPEAYRETQVIFHALAHDHAVLVVPAIGEGTGAVRAFVADGIERGEVVG